jgi:hypothetical protein
MKRCEVHDLSLEESEELLDQGAVPCKECRSKLLSDAIEMLSRERDFYEREAEINDSPLLGSWLRGEAQQSGPHLFEAPPEHSSRTKE